MTVTRLDRVGLTATLLIAWTGPGLAQTLGRGPTVEVPWLRLFGAFGLCVLLAVGGALALRTRQTVGWVPIADKFRQRWAKLFGAATGAGGERPKRLMVLETVQLNHHLEINLLRLDGRDIVVAATPNCAFLVSDGRTYPPGRL